MVYGFAQERTLIGGGKIKKKACIKRVKPMSQLQRGTKRPSGKVTRKKPRQKDWQHCKSNPIIASIKAITPDDTASGLPASEFNPIKRNAKEASIPAGCSNVRQKSRVLIPKKIN